MGQVDMSLGPLLSGDLGEEIENSPTDPDTFERMVNIVCTYFLISRLFLPLLCFRVRAKGTVERH